MKVFSLVTILSSLLLAGAVQAQQSSLENDTKQLWQLIDYMSVDYGGAVNNGVVVSESEFAEMVEFTQNAVERAEALPAHENKKSVVEAIKELYAAVERKGNADEIARLAHHADALLITAYPIPMSPKAIPDLSRGAALFATNCSMCHGNTGHGNGPLAANLDPKPIDFTDHERAQSRSLMALYQVISQGLTGTPMVSFAALPEDDRWALAFFVGSLSHDETMRAHGEQLWSTETVKARFPDLTALTTATESTLAESLPKDDARDVMAYLRTHPNIVEADKPTGLALTRLRLKESFAALESGDQNSATRLALAAYLDGFEPLEPTLGARNKQLKTSVEEAMLSYRSAIGKGDTAQAKANVAKLDSLLSQVDKELGSVKADPTTTFIGAITILLREGVEALLIVVGMIAFLKKAERRDVLRQVHFGWISALIAGIFTWIIATYLVGISGASREVTEGVGSVFAAVVLLGVGLWMHQKSSANRWQAYLSEKLSTAMSRRSVWALFVLSFVAVYREVFETILFYSALAADGNGVALLAGFLTAVALLAIIAWALLRTSALMPIGKFFSFTSILVAVLSVVLIGKGVAALQEAGWFSATRLGDLRIEILGIYPSVETTIAQALTLIITLAGFGFNSLSSRNKGAKA